MPYRWLLAENSQVLAEEFDLGFQQQLEDRARELIGFNTSWVQTKPNHLVLLDTFFSAIEPAKSLCFLYAKSTPLTDDPRRVMVGVGRIAKKEASVEYSYSAEGELRAMTWETPVSHSIRPGFQDGFLLPYHDVLKLTDEDPSIDPTDFVALAPKDAWESFSFGTEHVSNDTAIAALLECERVVRHAMKLVPGPWPVVLEWIDARLSEIWTMRGAFPGLGAALVAFGVPEGNLVAYELEARLGSNQDPWPLVDTLFGDPSAFGLEGRVGPATAKKWNGLPDGRKILLKLLARFDLSIDQAKRFYQPTERDKEGVSITDTELVANPYLLYELDRYSADAIPVATIDRGTYPDPSVRETHPLTQPSAMLEDVDPRRARALMVSVLEAAAASGHTVRPRDDVVQMVRDMAVSPPCPVDIDLMNGIEGSFSPTIGTTELSDGATAYQLGRLNDTGDVIRRAVERRIKGKRLEVKTDWAQALDRTLGGPADRDDEEELRAREEKVAALKEMAASRLSVLIGPAGTGKTTLLSVLVDHPAIRAGGVLMLAPTGKARVQMERATGQRAQTLGQFLLPLGGYEPETGAYRITSLQPKEIAKTVIIDECSMLTEEALAAVFSALSGVERYILVGDPRQLPPIGSGRPFVDIITRLRPANAEGLFPRVVSGHCDLTILRRQVAAKGDLADRPRPDLALASWFGGTPPTAGADEVWSELEQGVDSPELRFVPWSSPDELRQVLLTTLVEELKLSGPDDVEGFERWLGGEPFKESTRRFFWRGKEGKLGASAKADEWQILSPLRSQGVGATDINRFIQLHFRGGTRQDATARGWGRKIPQPVGSEGILYGDKVIQIRNQRNWDVFPKSEEALRYVANGEIGIVVGQYKTKYLKGLPWKVTVEFSSQPGFEYGYGRGAFGDDGEPPLELAYAITVHKSQGSEFGLTLLVIPNPCRLLSRELLYTALTRQQARVVILHQGDPSALKEFAAPHLSETASRLTNLFTAPNPIVVEDRFLESALIHKTRRGEAVRSKSEVIIADLLYSKGVDYAYERRLVGADGSVRYPDFTIEDSESGMTTYWEHLGMLHDSLYRAGWERKKAWYARQGVLPYGSREGADRVLLSTRDDEKGAIDSGEIERLAADILSPQG